MPLGYEPGAGRDAALKATDKAMSRVEQLGLTARQRKLNYLMSWYAASQYDNRKVEFDGRERLDPLEREAVVTASFIPPGFYDVGQQYPLKFRRPLAPYHLCRVIVDRFTELLFAENRIPRVRVLGDPLTEDYVQAIMEATDFWGRFMQARKLGGAMGSVAIGFQFVKGHPQVEVHDPRWCFPDFEDRVSMKLNLIEKRWIYTKEERVPGGKTGWKWADVPYWYRRIIDKDKDILFKPVKVEKGDEPLWEIDFERSVEHKLGFCPVVWIQNHEVPDDIDGESDCHGTYDQIEQMDLLTSMAVRGVVLNCDPTVVVTTDMAMDSISKGSDNTVKLPVGGSFAYSEISGTGPKAARELAAELREAILEVNQVHLPPADGGQVQQTLGQVERTFSSMLAKASLLRRQYGKAATDLLKMIMRAAMRMQQGEKDASGMLVRKVLRLPPKVVEGEDGKVVITPRKLGGGGHLRLIWPKFFEYSLDDIQKATTAAGEAKTQGLIDGKTASEFVAGMYHVDNVGAMLAKIKAEQAEAQAAMMGGAPPEEGGEEPLPEGAEEEIPVEGEEGAEEAPVEEEAAPEEPAV